jgi:hypothetical protein
VKDKRNIDTAKATFLLPIPDNKIAGVKINVRNIAVSANPADIPDAQIRANAAKRAGSWDVLICRDNVIAIAKKITRITGRKFRDCK